MRTALLLAITLATLQESVPQFEVELWPGEGRPAFEAVVAELPLREQPSVTAAVVKRLRVGQGQKVEFGRTILRTVTPGVVRTLESTRLMGRRLGAIQRLARDDYYSGKFPRDEFIVSKGDIVEYLQYRAEGTCFIRLHGSVLDVESCPAQNNRTFAVESEPKLEWWIEVLVSSEPSGWLLVTPR